MLISIIHYQNENWPCFHLPVFWELLNWKFNLKNPAYHCVILLLCFSLCQHPPHSHPFHPFPYIQWPNINEFHEESIKTRYNQPFYACQASCRVAMMSTCTHKGPIFQYKACRQSVLTLGVISGPHCQNGAFHWCHFTSHGFTWSEKSTQEKQTSGH